MPHFIHAKGGASLPAFDFAVIRFSWIESQGADLDTRTMLEGVSPDYDGLDIGWCRNGTASDGSGAIVGPPGSFPDSGPFYLFWGGDNTSPIGTEAHLVDFAQIAGDFPALTTIRVRLRAFWYSTRLSGDLSLSFTTYLGGTMVHDGTDFTNAGGVQVSHVQVPRNAVTSLNDCIDGDEMGFLTYAVATKEGTILDP